MTGDGRVCCIQYVVCRDDDNDNNCLGEGYTFFILTFCVVMMYNVLVTQVVASFRKAG